MLLKALSTLLLIALLRAGLAQNPPDSELHIKKISGEIVIDGEIDEPAWQDVDVARDFYLHYPHDTSYAKIRTEARVAYDDDFFYVSIVCHDTDDQHIVQSLRRDFDYENNDNVGFVLGTFNDQINGFYFVITPENVQQEGTIDNGGNSSGNFSDFWDCKWYSKTTVFKDKWVAEIALPFKSIRYKNNNRIWEINFARSDLKRNRASTWTRVPIEFDVGALAHTGRVVWDEPPPVAGSNMSFIPYVSANLSADHLNKPGEDETGIDAGFDAKIGVTPSLNLDLTFNPDFSQVEVDEQVINLTQFEYHFPERRQFFLENNDVFETAGFPEARPFFTRRIGLAADTSGSLQEVPIVYGARLSGSISPKWRTNIMNMMTGESEEVGLPNQFFTVGTIQRNFGKQSNAFITITDKRTPGLTLSDRDQFFNKSLWKQRISDSDTSLIINDQNTVVTADMELFSPDARWNTSFFYSASLSPHLDGKNQSGGAGLVYRHRHLQGFAGYVFIQENYNAELGFVPSQGIFPGYQTFNVDLNSYWYPKNENIIKMGPFVSSWTTGFPGGGLRDFVFRPGYRLDFANTSSLSADVQYTYQKLTIDFNPIDPGEYQSFLAGEDFKYISYKIDWTSDTRKLFNYELSTLFGGFYNGNIWQVTGGVNYRIQPYGKIALFTDFRSIHLPENYGKRDVFNLGMRLDLTLTNTLYLTTYLQYNNLAENINLNARLQWRYSPASDLFLVYTENYFPGDLSSKNRALVFKLSYWFNL